MALAAFCLAAAAAAGATRSPCTSRRARARGSSISTTTTGTRSGSRPGPMAPGAAGRRSAADPGEPGGVPDRRAPRYRDCRLARARRLRPRAGRRRPDAGARRGADPRGDRLLGALRRRPGAQAGPGFGLRLAARRTAWDSRSWRSTCCGGPASARGRCRASSGPGPGGGVRLAHRRPLPPLDRDLLRRPRLRLFGPVLLHQWRGRALHPLRLPRPRTPARPDADRARDLGAVGLSAAEAAGRDAAGAAGGGGR